MKIRTLRTKTPIHILIIFSIIATFFSFPPPANAGVLSKILSTLKPVLSIGGRIAGAVVGASMASAFFPPLGMIAGGIAGWVAGGMLTDFGTSSLPNLAFIGTGIVGALALGPGALGIIGGFLVGGLLGKIAMGLIMKADRRVTGGILFDKASAPGESVSFEVSAPATEQTVSGSQEIPTAAPVSGQSLNDRIQEAEKTYYTAYKNYIGKTSSNSRPEEIKSAQEAYQKAYNDYQNLKAGN